MLERSLPTDTSTLLSQLITNVNLIQKVSSLTNLESFHYISEHCGLVELTHITESLASTPCQLIVYILNPYFTSK